MTDRQGEQHVVESDAAKLIVMRRISLIIDVLLICGCVYLLASDIMKALSGTPAVTSRGGAFPVNLSATFALVHRSMALIRKFSPVASVRESAGVNKWSLALVLVLPLLVASSIELLVHAGHRAQLDVLVTEISSRTARATTSNAQVRAADLVTLQGPYLQTLTVRTDTGEFLLQARVPAFDADGFAARYSSTERNWYLDPYGASPETVPVFDVNGPVLVCRVDNQNLNCERQQL